METASPKELYYEDKDFKLELEKHEGILYLHCVVTNWTPSSLRRGYLVFTRLQQDALDNGFSKMRTITPNPKFVELFNAYYLPSIEIEGKTYEVMEWDLK